MSRKWILAAQTTRSERHIFNSHRIILTEILALASYSENFLSVDLTVRRIKAEELTIPYAVLSWGRKQYHQCKPMQANLPPPPQPPASFQSHIYSLVHFRKGLLPIWSKADVVHSLLFQGDLL